jgi:hypothetical protein
MKTKLSVYKETRNGMVGEDYLQNSAWLALVFLQEQFYDQVKNI